jgi:hypothetical protein
MGWTRHSEHVLVSPSIVKNGDLRAKLGGRDQGSFEAFPITNFRWVPHHMII